MDNRGILEQEIKQLEEEANEFRRVNNEAGVIAKNNEINQKRAELDRLAKEENITAVAEEITSSMETFSVGNITFTLEQLAIDEDAVEILRSGLKTTSKAQAQKFLDELNTQKAVYDAQLTAKQNDINVLTADRDALQNTNAQLQLEKDDLSEKRDAAAQQLSEAKEEIARLNSHVDDLRKEIANGSTPNNIIDITSDADLEAAAQRLKAKKEAEAQAKRTAEEAAKIRIYNVQPLDGTGARFGANRADNDEYFTFGWLERNQYVELSNEEATRFQQEANQAKQAELESVKDTEITTEPVDSFREFDTPELTGIINAAIQEHAVDGEVAATTTGENLGEVTREEFEALRHEVTMIAVELKSRSILPLNWEAA